MILGCGRLEASWAQPWFWIRGWGNATRWHYQVENIGGHVSQQAGPAGPKESWGFEAVLGDMVLKWPHRYDGKFLGTLVHNLGIRYRFPARQVTGDLSGFLYRLGQSLY